MKTAEELAEELYPYGNGRSPFNTDRDRKCFIAGHHSRDEEVRKLVEVLEAAELVIKYNIPHCTGILTLTKEALSQYKKPQQ